MIISGLFLRQQLIVEDCIYLVAQHSETWRKEPESYWLSRLIEEVGELAMALNDRHEHTPELELRQIAAIAINWLDMRAERAGK